MRRFALLGCAVGLVAAGCGGGGEAGGLTKEEFVAQLDQVCEDFNARQAEIGDPESLEDIVEQGPRVQDEFEAAVGRIRDLGDPPGEIAADVDRFLEIADESQELIGDLVEAAEDEDLQRATEIAEEGQALNDESEQIAEELGAPSCAEE